MSEPGPPPNAREIMESVNDALQGLELEPDESSKILGFANREVPYLLTSETSYFILGSYREPYIRRVRIVQNELNRRLGTYPFVLGDLPEIDVDRLPAFRIRFHLLATYTDHVVAVFEQDAGGEVTELGKISETPYFEKSSVLPRDYAWMTDRNLETPGDVLAAAITVHVNDDLDPAETEEELERILGAARANGVDLTYESVVERIEAREEAKVETASYSWVHLNEFRLFELHGRCFPWSAPDDLREVVSEIP